MEVGQALFNLYVRIVDLVVWGLGLTVFGFHYGVGRPNVGNESSIGILMPLQRLETITRRQANFPRVLQRVDLMRGLKVELLQATEQHLEDILAAAI